MLRNFYEICIKNLIKQYRTESVVDFEAINVDLGFYQFIETVIKSGLVEKSAPNRHR